MKLLTSILLAATLFPGQSSADEIWLNFGGFSYHHSRHLNNQNHGLVLQYIQDSGPWSYMAGTIKNSYRGYSRIVAVEYCDITIKSACFGPVIGIADKYGEHRNMATPVMAIAVRKTWGPFGLRLGVIPGISDSSPTYVSQFLARFR